MEADPAVARARLFEQMLTLLERLAEAGPVVLVIEDAHWADRSTRDLLAFLIGNQQVLDGVLIVVTYRSDELHRSHPLRPLLAELDRLGWVERMELPRLTRCEADELVARILGREPEPRLADQVYRRAEGNPLFVEELLCCDGGLAAELPESLRDLLLAAVQRLPEETQEVLRAASRRRAAQRARAARGGDRAGRPTTLARGLRPAVAANVLRGRRGRVRVPARADPRGDLRRSAARRAHPAAHPLRRGPRLPTPALVPPGRAADRAGAPLVLRARHGLGAGQRLAGGRGRPGARSPTPSSSRCWPGSSSCGTRCRTPRERIGASHLPCWSGRPPAAQGAGEPERGIAFASAALKEVDPAAEPVRAALLLETRATLGDAQRQGGSGRRTCGQALGLVPAGAGDAARARVLVADGQAHGASRTDPRRAAAAEEALSLAQRAGDAATQVGALCSWPASSRTTATARLPWPCWPRPARSPSRQDAYRPLLQAAINESHVLEGMGEHETGRRGGAGRDCQRAGVRPGPLDRHLPGDQRGRAAGLARPLGRGHRGHRACPGAVPAAGQPSRAAAARRRYRAAPAATWPARGSWPTPRARRSAGPESRGAARPSTHLPVARLEAELFLAEGKPADALATSVTAAADRFDLVHSPRYAWPLLAAGARACAAAPAAVRGPAAAERAGDLLGRLRTLAGKMDARGPVQLAHRLTFAAEAGRGAGRRGEAGARPDALARWDAAAAAWERARASPTRSPRAAAGRRGGHDRRGP